MDVSVTSQDLDALAAFVPVFEAPGFQFGHWTPATEVRPGVTQMPYYVFSRAAEDFRAAVGRAGLITPFDWGAWLATPEGQAMKEDRAALARADLTQIAKLLTAIIRSDRFTEGSFAGAFESGLLTAIARRIAVLRHEGGASPAPAGEEGGASPAPARP